MTLENKGQLMDALDKFINKLRQLSPNLGGIVIGLNYPKTEQAFALTDGNLEGGKQMIKNSINTHKNCPWVWGK